jgi:hypothetical protein
MLGKMKKNIGYVLVVILVMATMLYTSCTGVQSVKGDKGDRGDLGQAGNGIANTSYNSLTGVLTINFTNGTSFSTTDLRGHDGSNGLNGIGITGQTGQSGSNGKDGVGISSTSYNVTNGVLTINLTNGLKYSTSDLRGKDGQAGSRGATGIGLTGATGNGISSTSYDSASGMLTIYFTNGAQYTTPDIRGQAGTNGTNGTNGVDGKTYIESPFTGLALCTSVNAVGGSVVNGNGVFNKIGVASIDGVLSLPDWKPFNGHNYQLLSGTFTITSASGSVYIVSIVGYQLGEDGLFAGTYTFTLGATGSGSITATIDNETGTSRDLHLTIYGTFY